MSKSSIKQKVASDYTPEFRVNAIKLAQSGEKSFAQTAKDLGIPVSTLYFTNQGKHMEHHVC